MALPEPFGVSKCEAVRRCGSEVFLLSWLEIERPPIEWRPKCRLKGSVKSEDLLYEAVCAAVVLDLKISNEA